MVMKNKLRESDIETYLVQQWECAGGEVRKVKWIGRHSAPDRMLLAPNGIIIFVELKKPHEVVTAKQKREHARLTAVGQKVYVINSLRNVDYLIEKTFPI